MKKIKYYILGLLVTCSVSSCEDYLTVLPENNQSSFEYWETKEDVEAVLAAGYVNLRSCVETFLLWGEARGNGLDYLSTSGSDLQKAGRKLRDFDILPDNKLCDYSKPYAAIAMANAVIKYASDVVEKDPSFDRNMCRSFMAEAFFQRSLAYFYLVRTFKDTPFVVEPYVDDSAPYVMGKTDGTTILKSCISDLETYLPNAKEFFPEVDNDDPINTKGRATQWGIHALLADMYLWMGDYDNCISHCNSVISSGRVGLINNGFMNFFPGNSNEGIFEIQYSNPKSQTNSFQTWFKSSSDGYYKITEYVNGLFDMESNDIRGLNYTYNADGYIWKYLGVDKTTARAASENDQNYIIYRLADVLLMKAEALIMQGHNEEAADLIDRTRERAGLGETPLSDDRMVMLETLLVERQKEFFGEGKNWFDLLRIGLRSEQLNDTQYKTLFVEQALKAVGASRQSLGRATLANSGSWYLPYSEDELSKNPLLEQSDYYQSISN